MIVAAGPSGCAEFRKGPRAQNEAAQPTIGAVDELLAVAQRQFGAIEQPGEVEKRVEGVVGAVAKAVGKRIGIEASAEVAAGTRVGR